jgi:hypothetical protein
LSNSFWVGIVLILVADVMAGNCMLPLKLNRSWRWEKTWLIFSLASLLVLPWTLALSLVHHLFQIYLEMDAYQLGIPFPPQFRYDRDSFCIRRLEFEESPRDIRGCGPHSTTTRRASAGFACFSALYAFCERLLLGTAIFVCVSTGSR